ncbi:MAG: Ig-like domain-containing protein, partial [Cytophagia bacterium]|nr:Ig-like domain-containing protein [Cytophagia bacterium]
KDTNSLDLSLSATLQDAAGNDAVLTLPTPGTANSLGSNKDIIIDTTAPNAPSVTSISTDTGVNGTDGKTNDNTITISGTLPESNVTVEVFIDGVSVGQAVVGLSEFTFDYTGTELEDGEYEITARATDVAGNTGALSSVFNLTIDTAAPDAPTIGLDPLYDTGFSDSDNLTNSTTLKFTGVAEIGSDVEVFVNDVSQGVTAPDVITGEWSTIVSSLPQNQDVEVKAVATDYVGNTGAASEVLTVSIDNTVADPTFSPADNAVGVLPSANLVLTFEEEVRKSGNTISIRKSSDNSILESFDVSSDKVTVNGSVVTINPDNALLPAATEFYVIIGQGAFIDNAGNDYMGISNNTTWTFTTIDAAVVTAVSVPSAETYGIGDNLDFELTFSQEVTMTGSPTIDLTIGSETVTASLQGSVTASTTATFRYTVEEGDLDTDGISIGSTINLNGGTLKDAFDIDALADLNNVPSLAAILVDGVKPTPTITSDAGSLTNAAFTATFTYDEEVTGLELGDISVTNGTASNFTNVTAGTVWNATITPTADGETTVTLNADVAADAAGNASKAGNTVSTTFDGTAPTVTSITRAESDQIPTGTTSRSFTVVFSEDVTGVDVSDFEVVTTGSATASINRVTATDAKTYTVNVNGISGEGTIGLNAKDDDSIIDAATNPLGGTFTGEIYATNFVPTDISISTSSIQENNAVGAEIGIFATTDADAGDSFTYSLVSGTGDADNSSFTIGGGKLLAAEVFDFETKDSYSIRVKTEDSFGGNYEEALTISITNEGEAIIVVTGDGVFDQTVLGLSSTKSWTVENQGDVATEVRIISSSQGFSVTPGSVQVNPGETKNITAVFRPREARVYSGVVVFNYDITDNIKDNVLEIGLTGEGVIVTGLDNGQISEEQINVFPNPASTSITIDLSELHGMP